MTKQPYRTKHRDELLSYLKTVPGVHITVGDICAHFREEGSPIGQTTVYRHLERMVGEGIVRKYIIDVGSPACFEYTGAGDSEPGGCFHCKCEVCGKLIHLHCEELAAVERHLQESHQFLLDPLRTVFYGRCAECREKEGG